jgi:hypothetical protein
MQNLEVSCAVRPIYGSLGAKGLSYKITPKHHIVTSFWPSVYEVLDYLASFIIQSYVLDRSLP